MWGQPKSQNDQRHTLLVIQFLFKTLNFYNKYKQFCYEKSHVTIRYELPVSLSLKPSWNYPSWTVRWEMTISHWNTYTTTAHTNIDGYKTSEQIPLERMLVRYHHQVEEPLNGAKYGDCCIKETGGFILRFSNHPHQLCAP